MASKIRLFNLAPIDDVTDGWTRECQTYLEQLIDKDSIIFVEQVDKNGADQEVKIAPI